LDARLTTLLCKRIIAAKSKEVKTGCSNTRKIWQNFLRKAMAQNDDDDDDDDDQTKGN
jgi:hypothetical protein